MDIVKDIMVKKITAFGPDSSVNKIAKVMGVRDIGAVIIVGRNKKPLGIITERDMVKRVIAKNLNPRKTKAKDIMTSPVQGIHPDANIYYTSKMMQQKGFKRYPVVKNNKVVGFISQSTLIDYFTKQRKKFVLKYLSKKLRKEYL
ncbi:MAG: CBS domain-containing protein [Nanoarchaeota archaeon]